MKEFNKCKNCDNKTDGDWIYKCKDCGHICCEACIGDSCEECGNSNSTFYWWFKNIGNIDRSNKN